MSWILILAIGGFAGMHVSDVRTVAMTQAQCKAALEQLRPLRRSLGAVCVGPNGESYGFDDIDEVAK